MKPRLGAGLLAAAAAAMLIVLAAIALRNGPLTGTEVTQARVATADLTPQVFGIGTVEARRAYLIGPTVAGRLREVAVDHGDTVRAGQVLAELDPVDLDDRLAGARSAVERAASAIDAAQAQLRETESRSAIAGASAARFTELRARGFVSKEAVDGKQHEANAAYAAREGAQAGLAAARRDAARLDADRAGVGKQRAQYRLQSPIDGLVVAREAEPGSTVLAGQAVLRLIDPRSLWVKARIDQGRAAGLAVGQKARVVLRSNPQSPLPGRIARIEIASDSITEERLVGVEFENPPSGLSTGELVEVTISLPAIKGALVLPSAAIHRVGQRIGVWRIDGGKTVFALVEAGANTLDGQTEIRAGLARGDMVVHHAPGELRSGERVRVVDSLVR